LNIHIYTRDINILCKTQIKKRYRNDKDRVEFEAETFMIAPDEIKWDGDHFITTFVEKH